MTPKQRKEHIQNIKDTLVENGWEEDRFGHYKKDDYRIKMQKTSLRFELKMSGSRWHNCCSDYYKNINVADGALVIKNRAYGL